MSLTQFIDPLATLAEKFIVTAVQAGVAFWVASGGQLNKLAFAAAVGAGASAGYNVVLKPAFRAFRDNVVKPWLVGRGLLQG